jgi:asparagine synthase (glutamine-hydrolysing)
VNDLRNRRYRQVPWLKIDPEIPSWYSSSGSHYGQYHLQHGIDEVLSLVLDWEYQRVITLGLKPVIPFLDLELLRTSLRFPVNFTSVRGISKYLGRLAYSDVLPPEVVWNKRKLGYELPLEAWTAGVWREEMLAAIRESHLLAEIADVQSLIGNYDRLSSQLRWSLYTAARFLHLFG